MIVLGSVSLGCADLDNEHKYSLEDAANPAVVQVYHQYLCVPVITLQVPGRHCV
jgi:hypothetical protein